MSPDVHVVIRSNGENTLARSREIIQKEYPHLTPTVLKEEPFSKAVRKTFEIGIESNKKWTLAVDADILMAKGSIEGVVKRAESLSDDFFMIQGRVLDKFFGFSRNGGPHLFRTELCLQALELIPDSGITMRPEGATVGKMVERGFHRYKGTEVYGIHDFYQSNFDVFRKCYAYGKKFPEMAKYFLTEWAAKLSGDDQFEIACNGFLLGIRKGDLNIEALQREFESEFSELNSTDVQVGLVSSLEVQKFISGYGKSSIARRVETQMHSYVMRTDRKLSYRKSFLNFKTGMFKKLRKAVKPS